MCASTTLELVNTLELEKAVGKQGKLAFSLMQLDLVILDELGYLTFSQTGGALLFHLLSKLFAGLAVHDVETLRQKKRPL